MSKKIRITEKQLYSNIIKEMAYPSSFNIETFKSLTSFQKRIKYCGEHLKRLNAGSSRIVYQIDNEKVLKLAKNKAGIAQNNAEADGGLQTYEIAPVIYDEDEENNLWIESELAKPIKEQDFLRLVGYDFKTICSCFRYYETRYKPIKQSIANNLTKEFYNETWYNDWMSSMYDYIGDYQPPLGDLFRLANYGIVSRNGKEHIVVVDMGLTDDVAKKFYMR